MPSRNSKMVHHVKAQITFFMLLGLLILCVGLLLNHIYIIYTGDVYVISRTSPNISEILPHLDACDDGTAVGSCGFTKPYKCAANGSFIRDCRSCGCGPGFYCLNTDCVPLSEPGDDQFRLFLLPINYEPTDPAFLSRAGKIIDAFSRELNIYEENVIIVNDAYETLQTCDLQLSILRVHVGAWYLKHAHQTLPGAEYNARGIADYSYRIIGIDRHVQDKNVCGCGMTTYYGDVIYLGGAACSIPSHIALHEFGHTFGLCDEYDTCIWDNTNQVYPCRNTKPGLLDSDCGDRCCGEGGACCYGKYSRQGFNVMGSADDPPLRELAYETADIIQSDLCGKFGICEQ